MTSRTKELLLRVFDDTGAATLEKHMAQIEYTAYWCVHLLRPQSGIKSVVPEGVDDVLLERDSCRELHQVKCRDESGSPWTTAEVLPILCAQYHRRLAFSDQCTFHFVSDHPADNKSQLRRSGSYGSLYRLKYLLDIQHDGETMSANEKAEYADLQRVVIPRIVELMAADGEAVDEGIAESLLASTWIDTDSPYVRNRPDFAVLSAALVEALPGQPACTVPQLDNLYNRLINLIIQRITNGKSLNERRIVCQDVLDCRVEAITPEKNLPSLDGLPGNTIAEKKALVAGFDVSEMPVYAKQMQRSQHKCRELELLNLSDPLEDLTLSLMMAQLEIRRSLSDQNIGGSFGPQLLRELGKVIPDIVQQYFAGIPSVNSHFCYGQLWHETNKCSLWWHKMG